MPTSPHPDPLPPREFGRTAGHAARAAVLLALLGGGVVFVLTRMLSREQTPLGDLVHRSGIAPNVYAAAGLLAVGLVALVGFFRSVRSAPRFRLSPEGLEVRLPSLGRYLLAWENVTAVGLTPGRSLGIRIRDRETLLTTHQGTPAQRELLHTQPPFGEWDFLYTRADLGHPAEEVQGWLEPHLPNDS